MVCVLQELEHLQYISTHWARLHVHINETRYTLVFIVLQFIAPGHHLYMCAQDHST